MLLLASVAQVKATGLADCVAGADAGLLQAGTLSAGVKALQKASTAVPDIPWGLLLADAEVAGMEEMVQAGCDFFVFSVANTSLDLFDGDEVGKILQVDTSLGDSLVRSINELPVDAVLLVMGQEESPLTWYSLMQVQRLSGFLTRPLLVYVSQAITPVELQALDGVGVAGVVVGASVGQEVGKLKELRQAIDESASLPKSKRGKVNALVPRIGEVADISTEEEEEDE
jgi:hypothetical protein